MGNLDYNFDLHFDCKDEEDIKNKLDELKNKLDELNRCLRNYPLKLYPRGHY